MIDTRGPVVTLDVGGVGYLLTTRDGATRGEVREFFVHTVLRADSLQLYGFDSTAEREVFELLTGTPGVGPSTALAALRTLSLDQLRRALDDGDTKELSRVPGIGPKTASRIVLELRGRLVVATPPSIPDGVLGALQGLGYATSEIDDALGGVEWPDEESAALRMALARLAR
ncbi:MAG: Holliday junction branch migration protein RuvA [Acidimicrobiaceae bacterium]|nr:Holliday junction branch migration protein RuvA [Acidimicrobiaceae bacterium]